MALAKPKARPKASMTLVPIEREGRKPGAVELSGTFMGTLTISGHEFILDDGHQLGLISHICGVTSMKIKSPSLPEGVLISARKGLPREVLQLDRPEFFDESTFIKRTQSAMYACANSRKQNQKFIDWWEQDLYPFALSQVPERMRVNSKLGRGVYDENGIVLTAAQIAEKARWTRLVERLQNIDSKTGVSGLGFIEIPWQNIARMEDPHGPVAINGPAYLVVQRMLLAQGFPRMPQTYAELVEGHGFCESVTMQHQQTLISPSYQDEWMAISLKVWRQYHPESFPMFKACYERDEAQIAKVQGEKDWLAFLAERYQEEESEDSEELSGLD